jgi:alpha-beta hydrolase superfamily lysophospholipase
VFSRIADAGIAVFTYDAHGHGKSEPLEDAKRCMIYRFDDLVCVCVGVREGWA